MVSSLADPWQLNSVLQCFSGGHYFFFKIRSELNFLDGHSFYVLATKFWFYLSGVALFLPCRLLQQIHNGMVVLLGGQGQAHLAGDVGRIIAVIGAGIHLGALQ
jgi:hypothetical protein